MGIGVLLFFSNFVIKNKNNPYMSPPSHRYRGFIFRFFGGIVLIAIGFVIPPITGFGA